MTRNNVEFKDRPCREKASERGPGEPVGGELGSSLQKYESKVSSENQEYVHVWAAQMKTSDG